MTAPQQKLQELSLAAERSMSEFNGALLAFQANLHRHDRPGQEAERLRMVSAIESFCDNLMTLDASL